MKDVESICLKFNDYRYIIDAQYISYGDYLINAWNFYRHLADKEFLPHLENEIRKIDKWIDDNYEIIEEKEEIISKVAVPKVK